MAINLEEDKGSSTNPLFPINKRIRVTFDMGIDWNDPLASNPDSKLEEKRLHLIDNPLLLNKLFGIVVFRYLHEYLSQMERINGIFNFNEEDLLWAANIKYMANEDIFDELMFIEMGFGDESYFNITSTDAFTFNVNEFAIIDQQTNKKIDMSFIPNPMILEKGRNYLIGQGNHELMVMISCVLENEDTNEVIRICEESLDRVNMFSRQVGYKLARMGIEIKQLLKTQPMSRIRLPLFVRRSLLKSICTSRLPKSVRFIKWKIYAVSWA